MHPEVRLDPAAVELLLAAEIVGHYRSYQVLGPLQQRLRPGDPVLEAMGNTMEQELERIFRVMALLLPHAGLHDAYVGLRSSNPVVRGNAIEFLDNVLKPELRQLLVPLLDSSVTVAERIALANTPGRRAARDRRAGRHDAARERGRVAALVRGLRDWRDAARRARARARSLREGRGPDHAPDRAAGAAAAGRHHGNRDRAGAGAGLDGRRASVQARWS